MVNESVVQFGVEYLNRCLAARKQATLIQMLEHIDYFDRLIASADEINAVLAQFPSVFIERSNGQILFSSIGHEKTVPEEEAHQAYLDYNEDFQRRLEAEKFGQRTDSKG